MNDTFGQALRADRRTASLTQDVLAARTGVSQATISQLETGYTHVPDQATVEKLQTVLPLQGWTAIRATLEAMARKNGQTADELLAGLRRADEDYAANPGDVVYYDKDGQRTTDASAASVVKSAAHPADLPAGVLP